MRPVLLGVLFHAALAAADQPRPGIVVNPATDLVIPQVVDGDGWSTTFFLTSLERERTVHWLLAFYADGGFPMNLPIQGAGPASTLFAALPPNWSVTIQTLGTSAQLLQGWARLTSYDRAPNQPGAMVVTDRQLAGLAVFRQRVPGRPDFEAVVPLSPVTENRFVMPFDNRGNYSTGIAWLNPDQSSPVPVEVTIFAPNAQLIREDRFLLGPGSKVVFSMPTRYPESIGREGSILVRTPARFLSGLGLRFNPTGAFTSFHTLSAPGP